MAWILGLLQSALSLIGYDAVTHMMEEMPRPRRDAPVAMMTAVGIGGITYDILLLCYPFSASDTDRALEQWHFLYSRHALLHHRYGNSSLDTHRDAYYRTYLSIHWEPCRRCRSLLRSCRLLCQRNDRGDYIR